VELAYARRQRRMPNMLNIIERALYNGLIPGCRWTERSTAYRNPLAFDPSGGDKIPQDWYDVTSCPPNLERNFASSGVFLQHQQ